MSWLPGSNCTIAVVLVPMSRFCSSEETTVLLQSWISIRVCTDTFICISISARWAYLGTCACTRTILVRYDTLPARVGRGLCRSVRYALAAAHQDHVCGARRAEPVGSGAFVPMRDLRHSAVPRACGGERRWNWLQMQ